MNDKYKAARDALIDAINGKDPECAKRAKRALAVLDEEGDDKGAGRDPSPDDLERDKQARALDHAMGLGDVPTRGRVKASTAELQLR